MALPDPEEGLVVSYEYLWRRQDAQGNDAGEKGRPAVVVLVSPDRSQVMVAPITSQPVKVDQDVIDVPPPVAKHLGLDISRTSRIIVDEVNMFHWPNDLRPIPGRTQAVFHYGFMPPKLYKRIKTAVLENRNAGKLASVKRKNI